MGLSRKHDRYSSDVDVSLRSIKSQIEFIRRYIDQLRKVDKKGIHEKFINELPEDVGLLKDWERARVEKIYELVFEGFDLPAVKVHVDRKPKGLRF